MVGDSAAALARIRERLYNELIGSGYASKSTWEDVEALLAVAEAAQQMQICETCQRDLYGNNVHGLWETLAALTEEGKA